MPAFQLIGDRFSSGVFGTDAFGTSSFGGTAYAPVPVTVNLPSDDITEDVRAARAEIVHRRYGAIVGARKFATVRRWSVAIDILTAAELAELRQFYDAGRFYLLQDDDETGRRVEVYWPGEFDPINLRGGFYNLRFDLEEIL